MAPFGSFAIDPDKEKLERLRRGLEGLHGFIKGAVIDPVMLPGDVATGKFTTTPTTPGVWSDEDEARALINAGIAEGRAVDLAGNVMGSTIPAVASHVAQVGTKGLLNPDTLGIFAGAGALTADVNKLAQAQKMAKAGATPDDIWNATGWFQGADKKWRFEIDDSKMMLRPDAQNIPGAKIGDVVDHPELFAAYPDVRDARVLWGAPPNSAAYYRPNASGISAEAIKLSQFSPPATNRSNTLHELQHAVQSREEFARGGSTKSPEVQQIALQQFDADRAMAEPRMNELMEHRKVVIGPLVDSGTPIQQARAQYRQQFPAEDAEFDQVFSIVTSMGMPERYKQNAYRNLAGEVEARNVQARRDLSAEERLQYPPSRTQDVPDANQIVMAQPGAGPEAMAPVWSPFDNAGVYREKALREAESGGSSVRMFPTQGALDTWRGGTPAADTWDRAVAEAKAKWGYAKDEARDVMNTERARAQGLTAADENFLANNMSWSTGDVPAFKPGIRAYHGSPHDFDRFDMSKIGTGEGAQAYGHGLYFAENEGVARSYRDAMATDPRDELNKYLEGITNFARPEDISFEKIKAGLARSDYGSLRLAAQDDDVVRDIVAVARGRNADGTVTNDAMRALNRLDRSLPQPTGRMYEVTIKADPEQFLDWNLPLAEQSAEVQRALGDRWRSDQHGSSIATMTGLSGIKERGLRAEDAQRAASEILREAGIPGIKYLDQGSRLLDPPADAISQLPSGKWQVSAFYAQRHGLDKPFASKEAAMKALKDAAFSGTRNFVVFDDSIVDILRKYGLAGLIPAGAVAGAMEDDQ